jgi:hypothetical protein
VRQRKVASLTLDPLTALKPDRKLFAANSRRTNYEKIRQTKAKQHLNKVLEKGNKCKFDAEK